MTDDRDDAPDAQDQAEVFDETNLTRDGEDIAHPDMARDVFDVTAEDEDSDPVEIGEGDFDPDLADEAELEGELDLDDGVDEARALPGDADLVSTDDAAPADYEGGDPAVEDAPAPDKEPKVERRLDEGLGETFPASDPVSINPGAD
ncbi:MAG: primosomal protein [Caulobacteraceae bacterium]